MTKLREIYKCNICGNIVEVVHTGVGALVCCGQNMELLKEKIEDAATEKHVPYIEKTEKGILVKIGQNQDHPMEKEHYIEWIEVIAQGNTFRKFLQPGDKPQAEFPALSENVEAREYCNVHGLWKS